MHDRKLEEPCEMKITQVSKYEIPPIECDHSEVVDSEIYPGQRECKECGALEQFFPFVSAPTDSG